MTCRLARFTEIFLCSYIYQKVKKAAGFGKCTPVENTALEMFLKNGVALTLPSLDVDGVNLWSCPDYFIQM